MFHNPYGYVLANLPSLGQDSNKFRFVLKSDGHVTSYLWHFSFTVYYISLLLYLISILLFGAVLTLMLFALFYEWLSIKPIDV